MNNHFDEEKKDEDAKASEQRKPRTVHPGAVSVGKDEATRFDEKIALKRTISEGSIISYDDEGRMEQDLGASFNSSDKKPRARLLASSQDRVARPGAVLVGKDEATRFDQKIALKRTVSEGSVISYDDEGRMEQDLGASISSFYKKPKARDLNSGGNCSGLRLDGSLGGSSSSFHGKPEANRSGNGRRLQEEVAAKQQAKAERSMMGRFPSCSISGQRLEQDIETKRNAKLEWGVLGSEPGAVTVSRRSNSGRLTSNTLGSDVTTFSAGGNLGAAVAAMVSLDERIDARVRQNDSTPAPLEDVELQSALDCLEHRIAAKVKQESEGKRSAEQTPQLDVAIVPPSFLPKDKAEKKKYKDAEGIDGNLYPTSPGALVVGMAVVAGPPMQKHQSSPLSDRMSGSVAVSSPPMRKGPKGSVTYEENLIPEKSVGRAAGKSGMGVDEEELDGIGPTLPHYGGGALLDESDIEYGIYDTSENEEGLAIAVAVEEEDEDAFIPSAVQYDPDAKPPIYRTRRFRLYAFLVFIVVLVGAVAAGVGVSLARDEGSGISKRTFRESLGIREQVERTIGNNRLEDPSSPFTRALEWITHKDPLELVPEDPNFMQRYAMAYLYLATSEKQPWHSCNPPKEGENSTCIHAKLSSTSPTIVRSPVAGKVRWLSDKKECVWLGVFCDEFEQVRAIDLTAMNMTGSFPDGIQYLASLQSLTMSYGQLRGTIPKGISKMKHLVNLEAHYQSLTGTIPDELWTSRVLQRLNFGSNLISGTIGSTISSLRDLKSIYLFDTLVAGEVPGEMGDLQSLSFIRLHRNMLQGTLSPNLGKAKSLITVWLQGNEMSGPIPSEFGTLPELMDLRLQDNKHFSGSIPEELYTDSIFRLDLFNNNFTGTISENIGNMTDMGFFRVHDNNLHGKIPSNLSKLKGLTVFSVQGNDITGTVPEQLCNLHLESAFFQGVEADCLEPEGGGTPQVSCPVGCCTRCCDTEGEVCVDTYGDE